VTGFQRFDHGAFFKRMLGNTNSGYVKRSVTESSDLRKHIGPNEVVTSSVLIGRCAASGISQSHARQIVRRGSVRDGIWRSEKLALASNGRIFARREFVGSTDFIERVLQLLQRERPGLFRLAQKILVDEIALTPHARMLLASPLSPKKAKFPGFEAEIAALEEVKFGKLEAKDTIGERFTLQSLVGTPNSSAASLKAQTSFQIEIALTDILLDHFRRQNFIAWNRFVSKDFREGLLPFNNYPFFAASFSWLSPLLRWEKERKKPKPTPVVFHVSSTNCRLWDVDGFITRMDRAAYEKTSRFKLLGVIAAPDFDLDAWAKAKDAGLIMINFRQLFGDHAFEAIVQVQQLLKNVAGDSAKAEEEGYRELAKMIESLKTNPFIADLKALAFEALAGFLVKNHGWEEVQLNLKVPFELPEGMTDREIDVSGQKNSWDEVCIIECKAEAATKTLDEAYVRRFFTETVPAFLKAKCTVKNPSHCRAEIWTTGIVSDSAKEALSELALKKFIQPELVGRDQLIQQLPPTLESTKRLLQTIAAL